jgi:hypothetical protein
MNQKAPNGRNNGSRAAREQQTGLGDLTTPPKKAAGSQRTHQHQPFKQLTLEAHQQLSAISTTTTTTTKAAVFPTHKDAHPKGCCQAELTL